MPDICVFLQLATVANVVSSTGLSGLAKNTAKHKLYYFRSVVDLMRFNLLYNKSTTNRIESGL